MAGGGEVEQYECVQEKHADSAAAGVYEARGDTAAITARVGVCRLTPL